MSTPVRPASRAWYGQLWDAARALERYAFRQVPAALLIVMVWGVVWAGGPAEAFWSTQDLRAHGHTVTVTRVQVDVSADACRSPRCVTDIRIQLPDRPSWVLLRNPDTPTAVNDDAATGWQQATTDSGYAPPLRVLLSARPGGRVDAMATKDVAYATSPDGLGWFIAAVLVLLLALLVTVAWIRRFAALPRPRLKSWRRLRNT